MENFNWLVKIVDKGYTTFKDVYIMQGIGNNKGEIIRGDKIETFNEGEQINPSLVLPPEALQSFADALNNLGIKPQQGFLEGKLEGTEKHLEDMRTLVFKIKQR